jgi:glutathione S-transferase
MKTDNPGAGRAITLHHCIAARSFRPLWMLEELALPYTLTVWPFPPRVHDARYLEVHAQGTVPLLIDGATALAESAAACQYLAARYAAVQGCGGLDVAAHEPGFGAYLQWLHASEATLTFPQTLPLRYTHFEPPERRQPQVAADYVQWFYARLRTLEAALQQPGAGPDHVCAGRFTAAAVAAYWQALQQRPAFQRALAAEREAALAQGVSAEVPVPRLPGF